MRFNKYTNDKQIRTHINTCARTWKKPYLCFWMQMQAYSAVQTFYTLNAYFNINKHIKNVRSSSLSLHICLLLALNNSKIHPFLPFYSRAIALFCKQIIHHILYIHHWYLFSRSCDYPISSSSSTSLVHSIHPINSLTRIPYIHFIFFNLCSFFVCFNFNQFYHHQFIYIFFVFFIFIFFIFIHSIIMFVYFFFFLISFLFCWYVIVVVLDNDHQIHANNLSIKPTNFFLLSFSFFFFFLDCRTTPQKK